MMTLNDLYQLIMLRLDGLTLTRIYVSSEDFTYLVKEAKRFIIKGYDGKTNEIRDILMYCKIPVVSDPSLREGSVKLRLDAGKAFGKEEGK